MGEWRNGIRARLKIVFLTDWGFKSLLAHHFIWINISTFDILIRWIMMISTHLSRIPYLYKSTFSSQQFLPSKWYNNDDDFSITTLKDRRIVNLWLVVIVLTLSQYMYTQPTPEWIDGFFFFVNNLFANIIANHNAPPPIDSCRSSLWCWVLVVVSTSFWFLFEE